MTETIFNPINIAGIEFKNKIIRSATYECMGDECKAPSQQLVDLYVKLAAGGVGGIIASFAAIQQDGIGAVFNPITIDNDDNIPAFKRLVDKIHEYGTPIILQLVHAGIQTRSKLTGFSTIAPSSRRDKLYNEDRAKELSEEAIETIITNFVKAIGRAKQAGFDGVQIHAAHGYLLSSFLAPNTNKRKDKWGGSTENRARIVVEIIKRAQIQFGKFPIFVKINGHDGQRNGMRIPEAVKIARLLEQAGVDALEVSCGVAADFLYMARGDSMPLELSMKYFFRIKNQPKIVKWFVKTLAKPLMPIVFPLAKPLTNYNVEAASKVKEAVKIPVIVVGGINNLADIREILDVNKTADMVSMARPLLCEPNLVQKFEEGKQTKARCIYCNHCAITLEALPLKCYFGKMP